MKLSEVITKTNADLIAFAKEKLGERVPADIDSQERPALMELVKGIITKEQEVVAQSTRSAPQDVAGGVDGIETEAAALDALQVMGFSGREQVKAYLKGVEREKENQKKRVEVIEGMQKALDDREVKLNIREKDIDKKGKEVLDKLVEARTEREKAQELMKNHEALSKLS